ncbi:2212_t:CDS:10 [Dentiscutata erythropus]|uniref:RNA polymerase II subunit B1 CTD phosphatase RPAP2 homolog n=1 Tax=Dentiscutata erythropus TaxID=1348616 RepID=A0A9N8Z7C6_9GLOM|nr:2212_t:CDS:10 [Dentiscutata erythropus]
MSTSEIKQFIQLSLEWQEKLYETVPLDILRDSAKYILPHQYDEIIEERNASKLCGYPICSKPKQEIQGQFRISYHARKIYDISELKFYCSTICLASSKYFYIQLSDESLHLRDLQNWKPVDVIPLGVDPRDLVKQDQSTEKNTHQRIDYVENLMADLPPAPPGLVIKEKDDNELGTPLAPSPNQQDTYDAVEGFRVDLQNEKNGSPPTLTLQKDVPIVNTKVPQKDVPIVNTNVSQKTVKECESTIPTTNSVTNSVTDSVTDSSENVQTPINSDIKKILPKKRTTKKKNVVLQMSLFGKIWTALDRLTTSRTRKRFQKVNSINLENDDSMPLSDDSLMRIQIFNEKIMQCYYHLKKQLCITTNIESELIKLTSTFNFDNSSVMFGDLENLILLTISSIKFKITADRLSIDIPELYGNIFTSENDKNGPFKDLLGSLKLTIEEMDAFVRRLVNMADNSPSLKRKSLQEDTVSEKETIERRLQLLQEQLDKLRTEEESLKSQLQGNVDIQKALDDHYRLLHEYNAMKDIGQMLFGKCAELDGTTTKEIYERFGLELDD